MMKNYLILILLLCIFLKAKSQCTPYQVFVSGTDVSCNGLNNGSASIDSVSGQSPFQYFWQGPNAFSSSNSTINNLIPGTYSLTLVDANNCQSIPTFIVINEPTFLLQFTKTNVSCYGASTGSIIANVTGGIQPINYAWNNTSQNTNFINHLPAANYALTITDAIGCQKSISSTIDQPDSLSILIDSVRNISCFSETDGFIKISPIGGTGAYSYFWQGPNNYVNPNPTNQISNLIAGTYNISISDQNNCQTTKSITLTQPSALLSSPVINNISCYGLQDASINSMLSGGTFPYIYNWSNGEQTANIDSLFMGNYSVNVTDLNNCTYQESFIIIEPALLVLNLQPTDVNCFALSDGMVDLSLSGGTSPFVFNWNNNLFNSEDLINIPEGVYSVTVFDENSCQQTDSVYVSEPQDLVVSVDSIVHLSCNSVNDGQLSVSGYGGISPYTYSWLDTTLEDSIRGQLASSNYTGYLTDANNCVDSLIAIVNQPLAIEITTTINHHLCFGDSLASILIDSIYGGVGNYDVLWETSDSTFLVDSLYQHSISLIITDTTNCTQGFFFDLPSPLPLSINFNASEISCSGQEDGIINAFITGGTGNYQYLWSTNDTTESISNLPQGLYQLTIQDSNGCITSSQAGVSNPNPLISVFSINMPVSCSGGNNGLLAVNSSGGTSPYSYVWSNGDTTNINDSLSSGMHFLTTKDLNNCISQSSTFVNEPTPISYSSQHSTPSCVGYADGQISINVFGGTVPYQHHWTLIDTLSYVMGSAATYTDSIMDANNCLLVVTEVITDPQEISINPLVSDVSCFGYADGAIELQISGGNAPYSFDWSNGDTFVLIDSLVTATYFVFVTDANTCVISDSIFVNQPLSDIQISSVITNTSCSYSVDGAIDISVSGGSTPYTFLWNNSLTTEDLTYIDPGNYNLIVSDASSCGFSSQFLVQSPDSIGIVVLVDSVSCNGMSDASAVLNITGGTAPFAIQWFNNTIDNTIQNIAIGTYSVDVIDSNNCFQSQSFSVFEPLVLSIALAPIDISCFGENDGVISPLVIGGNGGYSYLWNNADSSAVTDSLTAGIYNLTVTDVKNCSAISYGIISEPSAIYQTTNVSHVSCYGLANGMIDLSVLGGVTPYSFDWSNGTTNEDLSNVVADIYTLNIIDANNCIVNVTDTINEPIAPILINDSIIEINCSNASNGSILLDVTGGTSPYSYVWSSGQNTAYINQLSPGQYSVLVLDDKGCSENYSTILGSVNPITKSEVVIDESCLGANNGSIALQIDGGFPPYAIQWQTGDTGLSLQGLGSGSYFVSITDSVNCLTSDEINILAGSSFLIDAVINDVKCFSDSSGSISLNIINGTPPYTINWNDGSSTMSRLNLVASNYTVQVIDSSNCIKNKQLTIYQPDSLFLELFGVDVSCGLSNDGTIEAEISGGVSPYVFDWSNGDQNQNIFDLSIGDYSVVVTDSNNCMIAKNTLLTTSSECIVIPTVITPNGDGSNDSWEIKNLENYEQVTIQVIDENGLLLFQSDVNEQWDGSYKGKILQAGTYYYIVILDDNQQYTGAITLVR